VPRRLRKAFFHRGRILLLRGEPLQEEVIMWAKSDIFILFALAFLLLRRGKRKILQGRNSL